MEANIKVDNLKCGGCANTIKRQLKTISGITGVVVFPERGEVRVSHSDDISLIAAKEKLGELGYPEEGTTQGVNKFTSNVKSYVSCAVGRLSKEEEAK